MRGGINPPFERRGKWVKGLKYITEKIGQLPLVRMLFPLSVSARCLPPAPPAAPPRPSTPGRWSKKGGLMEGERVH